MQIYLEIIAVTQVSHFKVGVPTAISAVQINGLFDQAGTAVYRNEQGLAQPCA